MKKIFISSDHAGYSLKEFIKTFLKKKKLKYFDLGPTNNSKTDYPLYAHVGILVCGSGTGMNITANKHKNIRAAQCFSTESTKLSRLHNDANVITLGSRLISKKKACSFVQIFLKTKFEGGRHIKRIRRI